MEIKSADVKDTFFVLEFCGFPNYLDVRERPQTAISCLELLGRLKCQAADRGGAVVLLAPYLMRSCGRPVKNNIELPDESKDKEVL